MYPHKPQTYFCIYNPGMIIKRNKHNNVIQRKKHALDAWTIIYFLVYA